MRHLFIANPMLAELQREKNRALAEHNWRGGQLAARILLLAVYLFLLVLTVRWVEYVEPYVVLYVLLALEVIMVPASLHGAIAGEREKRSLDMLLVAPVTPGQIVVGKLSKALLTLVALGLTIGVPGFIIELVKGSSTSFRPDQQVSGLLGFLLGLLLCLTTGLALAGLTMWVSSKTKTNSSSLLSIVGALFLIFFVTSMVGASGASVFPGLSKVLIYMNPFTQLYWCYTGGASNASNGFGASEQFSPNDYYWPLVLISVASAVTLSYFATSNLRNLAKGEGS